MIELHLLAHLIWEQTRDFHLDSRDLQGLCSFYRTVTILISFHAPP